MWRKGPALIEQAVATAEAVLAARYPNAEFALVAGSIVRGEGTALSDIDLVVLFGRLERARRESFLFGGFPVEAFVHDPETLRWFMDQDVERGRPSIISMVAEGRPIGSSLAGAEPLQMEAVGRLERGPPTLTGERLNSLRYEITDLVDDLRGQRTPREVQAIGTALYQKLADLVLLGRGKWTGSAKWIPRLIGELDQPIAQSFDEAFRRLFVEGQGDSIIAFARIELERHGGTLFEGDCREAPASARRGTG